MSKVCKFCALDLRGQEDAIYSKFTDAHYCPVPLWQACHDREESLFAAKPSKRRAA